MKNSKAPKKQNAAPPAVRYENPWREAAGEAGSELGKILKFNKGQWQIGDDIVLEGTEYICFIDEVARGLIKFEDHSVTERHIVKVRDGKPPERKALGDNDESKWEIGDNGNGLLPIVALGCRSYKHPDYGKVLTPDLLIVGWHGTASSPPPQSSPDDKPSDDEIPY